MSPKDTESRLRCELQCAVFFTVFMALILAGHVYFMVKFGVFHRMLGGG